MILEDLILRNCCECMIVTNFNLKDFLLFSPHFQPMSCHPSATPPGSSNSRESLPYQPNGLSVAAGSFQLQNTADHSDHPYFDTTTHHFKRLPSSNSLSFLPFDSHVVLTSGLSSSDIKCREAGSSTAVILCSTSVDQTSQENVQGAVDIPIVSTSSQEICKYQYFSEIVIHFLSLIVLELSLTFNCTHGVYGVIATVNELVHNKGNFVL